MDTSPKTCYVYAHRRKDTDEIFYIGVGSSNYYNRAKSRRKRSKFWYNITSKTEYTVEILFDNLSYEQSRNKEKRLIKLLGRRCDSTGSLCNLTEGGDGSKGIVVSEVTREKLRLKGYQRKVSDKTKEKLRVRGLNRGISVEKQLKMQQNRRKEYGYWFQKKVVYELSGEIFPSIKEAALFFGINRHILARKLRGERKNDTNLRYLTT